MPRTRRNTDAWIEVISPAIAGDVDNSLVDIGVASAQALADFQDLQQLVTKRLPSLDASALISALHRRYLEATKPVAGASMTRAHRLRLSGLDRWNL